MSKKIGRPPLPVKPGQRFGRLTVVKLGPPSKSGDRRWWCECSCGSACVLVSSNGLLCKGTGSCGCIHRETVSKQFSTHGQSGTPEHKCWMHIRQRCENPNDHSYPDYGGRGIRVCERWQSFELFLSDMGPRPKRGYSIERIDVDGNYTPENCIWATAQQQARNKRVSIWIEYNGERLHIKEWEQRTDIDWGTLRHRYVDLSWSAERTLTTPPEAFAQRGAVTWNGETLTLTEWSQRTGIGVSTLHHRIKVAGWSVERALSEPVARRSNNKKAR